MKRTPVEGTALETEWRGANKGTARCDMCRAEGIQWQRAGSVRIWLLGWPLADVCKQHRNEAIDIWLRATGPTEQQGVA